ncbi:MAG: branched-chain amino acid ABC transporter permease [Desulfurococcales archaeon]|nr:branched-chain amino acid ABC transporter permease [Desulfurococcales archaeon]
MVDLGELLRFTLQGLLTGFLYGSVLGVVAVGLTLIWGVMKVVNLAHGHLVVLGSMFAAYIFIAMGLNPILIFILFLGFGAIMGAILYYSSIHKIIGKVDVITLKEEMATLMTTFGFGITLFGLHYVINHFKPDYSTEPSLSWKATIAGKSIVSIQAISLGEAPFTISITQIVAAILALLLALALHLLINKTTLGLTIRAVAQDSRALALAGINPVNIKLATTVISSSVAVAAGVLYIIYTGSATPVTESIVAPLSFVIVVLGGLGSILGTYAGGLILGIIYQVIVYSSQAFFGQPQQALALATAFAILLIMLIVRPQGLFGKRG